MTILINVFEIYITIYHVFVLLHTFSILIFNILKFKSSHLLLLCRVQYIKEMFELKNIHMLKKNGYVNYKNNERIF